MSPTHRAAALRRIDNCREQTDTPTQMRRAVKTEAGVKGQCIFVMRLYQYLHRITTLQNQGS